jgi:hypothetical protein
MAILKFGQSRHEAFAAGFVKGLTAPVELFRADAAPRVPKPARIEPPTRTVYEALTADWNAVGRDLRMKIELHEQQGQEPDTEPSSRR